LSLSELSNQIVRVFTYAVVELPSLGTYLKMKPAKKERTYKIDLLQFLRLHAALFLCPKAKQKTKPKKKKEDK
jgi:hypothetical protein